jgi:hypothetical protein
LAFATPASAHDEDFDALMAGELVVLDWGNKPLILIGGRVLEQPLPQAADLIRDFVRKITVDDTDELAFVYGYVELVTNLAPYSRYEGTTFNYKGADATAMLWDPETKTLEIKVKHGFDPHYCGSSLGVASTDKAVWNFDVDCDAKDPATIAVVTYRNTVTINIVIAD